MGDKAVGLWTYVQNKYKYNVMHSEVSVMDIISYSTFRKHLAGTLDKVNDDHKPILITRQNGKPAVVISLEDFQAYEQRGQIYFGQTHRPHLVYKK